MPDVLNQHVGQAHRKTIGSPIGAAHPNPMIHVSCAVRGRWTVSLHSGVFSRRRQRRKADIPCQQADEDEQAG